MKQSIFKIESNHQIAANVYRLELTGDTQGVTTPGQFVNVKLPDRFLRRPISVCNRTERGLTLIYKVVGHGTDQLSCMAAGTELDILTGLGNGYDLAESGERPLLIGGGVGVPPLYWLCRELILKGKQVQVILGFNTREEVFLEQEFRDLGASVSVVTADGSYGSKGFVTDAMVQLEEDWAKSTGDESGDTFYSYFYTCGPMPMFRVIQKIAKTRGQFSFEERMGCGFGACMGCSCRTLTGDKRICKDGPVLRREEIIWE